jgi:nucleoid-associated protein YgaU
VVQGDNLWTISRDHLAAVRNRPASDLSEHEIASYWLRVIAVNRSSLRSGDPDLIFPGELIMFPPVRGS